MTKFEEEFMKKFSKPRTDGGMIISISPESIKSTFKDWQPPKEKVKIPQFVANVLSSQDILSASGKIRIISYFVNDNLDESWSKVYSWVKNNEETFIEAVLYGYEIEKPKVLECNSEAIEILLSKYMGKIEYQYDGTYVDGIRLENDPLD